MAAAAKAGAPRYQALAGTLQAEIARGVWPVGALIPTESELCARFGASRFTIREALRRLIQMGLIESRQGSGTRVLAREPQNNFVQELTSIDELLQYPPNTRLAVLRDAAVRTDVALANLLQTAPGESWHRIEAVRLVNEQQPICWTDIYVRPQYKSVAGLVGRDSTPVYRLLERRFGLSASAVNVQLIAGALAPDHAEALGVEAGAPMLTVVRRYRDDSGRIYEVSVSEHPAERFSYSINLTRSQ